MVSLLGVLVAVVTLLGGLVAVVSLLGVLVAVVSLLHGSGSSSSLTGSDVTSDSADYFKQKKKFHIQPVICIHASIVSLNSLAVDTLAVQQ